jgi:hypothetical protein
MEKLTENEIEDLKYVVEIYSRLWKESEEYTKRLEDLTNEREDLISKIERHAEDLERIREQESILENKLKLKYGEFKIDMETFEIFKVV